MTVASVFKVTDMTSKEDSIFRIRLVGERAIKQLRSEVGKFSRVVLLGFEINGRFKKF